MDNSQQWSSRLGFILAAVGSAIGLGNIWRFPYMVYENGGGAFLIPYFVALFTAGIPIMILEFGLGHRSRLGAPLTFSQINKKWEWLGWWQVGVSAIIAVYYVAIIGWTFNYMGYAFTLSWGEDPTGFYISEFLRLSSGPLDLSSFRLPIAITILIAWGISFLAGFAGVQKGLERANKIFMPLLIVMLLIVVIRALTLPGAINGLELMFKPDFTALKEPRIWAAAYGQIFFTLSIAFAIMITYSSYLPQDSDLVNNAMMTSLLNCGFSLLAGLGIFGVVGFMQYQAGGELPAKLAGVFLAFATIPAGINQMGGAGPFIGALFFLTLSFAGLSSFISINEVVIRALADKFQIDRRKATIRYTLVAGTVSMLFATGAGLLILDVADHYINQYGIALGGLIQVILLGWFYKLSDVRDHINLTSDYKVGPIWTTLLKVVTPLILGYNIIRTLMGDIKTPYEGYDMTSQWVFGWGMLILLLVFAIMVGKTKWKDNSSQG